MAPLSPKDPVQPPSKDDSGEPSRDLDALRHIVVGPDQHRIAQLERRLDHRSTRAHEMSRVLPDALTLSTARDEKIVRTLQPAIEGAIRSSVRKNPKVLADAIFPLMGPGIRKAISATIMGMIQSFNQLLNHSLSIQGFKWRIEAFRTHKTYAEIVLLHTLVYQVEQVFLIHRQSGLVLQHMVGPSVKFEDPDLVSGMLTAIEDFVQDSFAVSPDQSLDTLRIGSDRSVWIEQGGKAMLASVIRGTPPLGLRHRMADILNDIQLKFGAELDAYEGDPATFEPARDDLAGCLDTEFKASRKKTSPLLWVSVVSLLAVLVVWGAMAYRSYRLTQAFADHLQSLPGIVVSAVQPQGGGVRVLGLKDPLADDPVADPYFKEVAYDWRPYLSLEPELVLRRARHLLRPPSTVTLTLENETLVGSGEAEHAWIRKFYTLGTTLAGISAVQADRLVDQDLRALHALGRRIETTQILFEVQSSTISEAEEPTLQSLVADLQALATLCRQLERPLAIRIAGYTDGSGSEAANLRLSQERAQAVYRYLIRQGRVSLSMSVVGMGAMAVADHLVRSRQRYVGFEIINRMDFKQRAIP